MAIAAVRVQVPLRVQDVIAIIGKLMIAIFVLYIHHKITEAEARNNGSADFRGQRNNLRDFIFKHII